MSPTTTKNSELNQSVFGLKVENYDLLKQAYHGYLAEGRMSNATTKQRGEVRGGGRKPWRQKGTGRARVGSIRSPLWKGGGVIFGPTGNQNHSIKISKQSKRTALKQALSLAAQAGKVIVIPSLKLSDHKTKSALEALGKAGAKGRTLVVVPTKDDNLLRGTNNLADVEVVQSGYLNVYKAMNADTILFTKDAITEVEKLLGAQNG